MRSGSLQLRRWRIWWVGPGGCARGCVGLLTPMADHAVVVQPEPGVFEWIAPLGHTIIIGDIIIGTKHGKSVPGDIFGATRRTTAWTFRC